MVKDGKLTDISAISNKYVYDKTDDKWVKSNDAEKFLTKRGGIRNKFIGKMTYAKGILERLDFLDVGEVDTRSRTRKKVNTISFHTTEGKAKAQVFYFTGHENITERQHSRRYNAQSSKELAHQETLKVFQHYRPTFIGILKTNIRKMGSIKANIGTNVIYRKQTPNGFVETTPVPHFTKNKTITNEDAVEKNIDEMITELWNKISEFMENGSGWNPYEFINTSLKFFKYKVIVGSSFLPLPKWLSSKKCCRNNKNDDMECFKWTVLMAKFFDKVKCRKSSKFTPKPYKELENEIKFPDHIPADELFPYSINNIEKFEHLNQRLLCI